MATPSRTQRATLGDRTNFLSGSSRVTPVSPSNPLSPSQQKKRTHQQVEEHDAIINSSKPSRHSADLEEPKPSSSRQAQSLRTPEPARCSQSSIWLSRKSRLSLSTQSVHHVSQRPLLQSFVSSEKTDVFYFRDPDGVSKPPFTCVYSNGSKRGTGHHLVVTTEHGDIELVDTSPRELWDTAPAPTIINAHGNVVYDAQWRDDDAIIATSSGDMSVRLHDVKTQATIAEFNGHTAGVKALAWDPQNPALLSSAARDGNIFVWDTRVNPTRESSPNPVILVKQAHNPAARRKRNIPHSAAKSVTSILYLPNSPQQLVSAGSGDGILLKWDLRTVTSAKNAVDMSDDPTISSESKRPRGITSIALGTNDSLVYGLGTDGTIRSYLTSTLQSRSQLQVALPQFNSSSSLPFYCKLAASPCGRWLASGGTDGKAYLYDVSNGTAAYNQKPVVLKGQTQDVTGLSWATSAILATCADDCTVRVWRSNAEQALTCRRESEDARWHWKWAELD